MIDSQETGFESLQFPLEEPLHFRIRIKFNNGSKFGWQLRQNLRLGPSYHHRGTEALRKFREIACPVQIPSEPIVAGSAITLSELKPLLRRPFPRQKANSGPDKFRSGGKEAECRLEQSGDVP